MPDDEPERPRATAPRVGHVLYILVAVLAAIAGFGVVMTTSNIPGEMLGGFRAGIWRIDRVSPPVPAPDIAFKDADGKPRTLAEWKGKVVLVNFWATWCPPCRREMPGMDRLQARLGNADFAVVAINLDREEADAPGKYLTAKGLSNIGVYQDKTGHSLVEMGENSLPFTVLLDREGRIFARLLGPAEWDSPEAEALIRKAMAGSNG